MSGIKKGQERVVFGPNVNQPQVPSYGPKTPTANRGV